MKQLKLFLFSGIILASSICKGQFQTQEWNSVIDFKTEQHDKAEIIKQFLKERQSLPGNVSNLLVVVNPFGKAYDSASFKYPRFFGNADAKSLPNDMVVFLEEKIIAPTQQFYFYNNGSTLVYCYEKDVTILVNGVKRTNRETKLETYVKHNANWIMVASSGTFIQEPK